MGASGICLAVSLAAAQQQGQPTFRSSVDLVQVDVVVVDRDGKPVRGLTQADFTILDRGTRQRVATFDEVSREHPATTAPALASLPAVRLEVASNRTAQADRLVVLVVDDLHIWKGRTDRAKQIARDAIEKLGPQSSMAVLFTSGKHSTEVTEDLSMLATAVDRLQGRQSWRRPHTARDDQMSAPIDPEESLDSVLAKLQKAQDASLQDFEDNMTLFKTLQDAARMLGSSDRGRKAFVLLSEGFGKDITGLFGAMAPAGEIPQGGVEYATTGNAAATMTVAPATHHDFALLDMMEAMRRANVATYAIDPRGKVNSGDLITECFPAPHPDDDPCTNGLTDWESPVREAQHSLDIISQASGGFAVTNTNDFTSGMEKIVDDLDHCYLLGFYPADTRGKAYRPIEVRIAGHPEWTLRYRRGYLPGGAAPAAPKKADPLTSLSAGVLPATDLSLRLLAIVSPVEMAGLARVTLALEVSAPRRDLQGSDGKVRDTLKYEVLVVDEKKAKVRSLGGLEGRLTLSPAGGGERPPDIVSYQVGRTLDLKPGNFAIRVSALSTKLAKGGSVYLDVDVPDFHAATMALGTVIVGYADGARVPVAPTVAVAGRSGAPAATGPGPALPFPPTLDRVFAASDTLRVYVEGTARVQSGLLASLDVVGANGKVVASPSPSFSSGDLVRIGGVVPLQGLSPGAYLLRVTLAGGGQNATRETGFSVR